MTEEAGLVHLTIMCREAASTSATAANAAAVS